MKIYFNAIHQIAALLFFLTFLLAFVYSIVTLTQKAIYESGWYIWGVSGLFFVVAYGFSLHKQWSGK